MVAFEDTAAFFETEGRGSTGSCASAGAASASALADRRSGFSRPRARSIDIGLVHPR